VEPRRDWGRILVAASAALVVAATAVALFAPTGTEETITPRGETSERSTSIWEQIRDGEEDAVVAVALVLPALVALAALALDRTRRRRASRMAAAVLLAGFALLAAASVGVFFLPGAAGMVAAALSPDRARPT
jgi:hypothetical protein